MPLDGSPARWRRPHADPALTTAHYSPRRGNSSRPRFRANFARPSSATSPNTIERSRCGLTHTFCGTNAF